MAVLAAEAMLLKSLLLWLRFQSERGRFSFRNLRFSFIPELAISFPSCRFSLRNSRFRSMKFSLRNRRFHSDTRRCVSNRSFFPEISTALARHGRRRMGIGGVQEVRSCVVQHACLSILSLPRTSENPLSGADSSIFSRVGSSHAATRRAPDAIRYERVYPARFP